MPELHELPNLVDPEDLELTAQQQRRLWIRNHAFGIAFGATLVLATVLFARVMVLESQHASAVAYEAPAQNEVLGTASSAAEERTAPVAMVDSAATEPVDDEGALRITVVQPPSSLTSEPVANIEAPRQRNTVQPNRSRTSTPRSTPRRQTTRRSSPQREAPARAIEADAVPTMAVEKEAVLEVAEPLDKQSGTLTVQVRPWGSVFINDRLVNREVSHRFQARLEAGTYPVKVVHPVLGTWKGVARVEAGREVALFVNFNKAQ